MSYLKIYTFLLKPHEVLDWQVILDQKLTFTLHKSSLPQLLLTASAVIADHCSLTPATASMLVQVFVVSHLSSSGWPWEFEWLLPLFVRYTNGLLAWCHIGSLIRVLCSAACLVVCILGFGGVSQYMGMHYTGFLTHNTFLTEFCFGLVQYRGFTSSTLEGNYCSAIQVQCHCCLCSAAQARRIVPCSWNAIK